MTTLLTSVAVVIFSFVSILFVLSVVIKRNDIADIAWGTGIFLVSVTSFVLSEGSFILSSLLLILSALWGIRLTLRIFLRNIKKSEDYRYKKWRDEWGAWFYPRSYLQVYLLQGFLMIVVGYPFIHAGYYAGAEVHSGFLVAGLLIWVVGYFFEVVSDFQLDRFLSDVNNRGQIMNRGLWRYSRHPNYFGEVTMWWGIWVMLITLPLSYVALVSPLMITYLILKVSGIPMLEKKFADNQAFQAYKKKTNAFFPWFPKKSS